MIFILIRFQASSAANPEADWILPLFQTIRILLISTLTPALSHQGRGIVFDFLRLHQNSKSNSNLENAIPWLAFFKSDFQCAFFLCVLCSLCGELLKILTPKSRLSQTKNLSRGSGEKEAEMGAKGGKFFLHQSLPKPLLSGGEDKGGEDIPVIMQIL